MHTNNSFFVFRAFFVSKEMEGSNTPRCMSFWYYMYEPIVDTAGPNLGKLAVWTRTIDRCSSILEAGNRGVFRI